jgi:hypothetical protein
MTQLSPKHSSTGKHSALGRVEVTAITIQNIPAQRIPSSRPRVSIRDSSNIKIDGIMWLGIRIRHVKKQYEEDSAGRGEGNGEQEKIQRKTLAMEILAIGGKRSRNDGKEAGASQTRKSKLYRKETFNKNPTPTARKERSER